MESSSVPVKKVFTTTARKDSTETKKDNSLKESSKESVSSTTNANEVKKKKQTGIKKRLKKEKEPANEKEASNVRELEIIGKSKDEKILSFGLNSPILSPSAVPFVPSQKRATGANPVISKEEPIASNIDTSDRRQSKSSVNTTQSNDPSTKRKPVSRPKPNASDLRAVEVNQLKIRFSPTGFTSIKGKADDSIKMQCVMPITDPDFAYDLATVRLEILLPKGYPGSKFEPVRPIFTILNSDLPAAIICRIERNLRWGLNSLEGGILVCRPMLRYLEDNLEKWMVDDVRESAFKFVQASEIKITEKSESEQEEVEVEEEEENIESKVALCELVKDLNLQESKSIPRISEGDWLAPAPLIDQSSVGGTSYTLKLIFSNIRGIDLLTSQRVTFLAACDRCKFNFPVEGLRPFVDRIEHCPKCTNQSKFYYKSQLITPPGNFEPQDGQEWEGILGTVRFLRAKPVDLLPTLYQCACNKCYGSEGEDASEERTIINSRSSSSSSSSSSSCKIDQVKVGENINYNCFRCHQKIRFQIDRIEWLVEDNFAGSTAAKSKTKAKSSTSSGPALTVGSPLPKNGACEHYKKSFRWYRFPCCGQAFPCDECHGNKEHEIEWATRFICGFCSREQSIHVKECPECGKDTSASGRKHTSFWEGGKGVRNQVVMNRKDSKKYKNYSTNSTSAVKKKKDAADK